MDKSQDWATRIMHEASCHEANSFLTLTYSDEHLPFDYGLQLVDMQRWLKRLRITLKRHHGKTIRFFLCGEYGDEAQRPHYHPIIFGFDWLHDRYPWRKTKSGHLVYRSPSLEKTWPYGHAEIGTVTMQSAGYVSRYILKKIGGDKAPEHYTRTHPLTGEINRVAPEFITMSTTPGIGAGWYDKYSGDAFPSDFVIIDGQKRPIPRYYTEKLKKASENDALKIKWARMRNSARHQDNNTPERLATREESQHLRSEKLKREHDKDPS